MLDSQHSQQMFQQNQPQTEPKPTPTKPAVQQDIEQVVQLSVAPPIAQPSQKHSRFLFSRLTAGLVADLQVIYQRDRAARNWIEVLFCYPGLHALIFHRVAAWLYRLDVPVLPRLISHLNRFLTGVEIHPGAAIDVGVLIDHGMGVVIGETAIVGTGSVIYQGVTLGGTGKETGKRHPTIGKNVVIGAGAKVLGNIYIGDHARIGSGSVVLRDVPDHSLVSGIPARVIHPNSDDESLLAYEQQPDVEALVIQSLFERIKSLELQIQQFQQTQDFVQLPVAEEVQRSNLLIEEFLDGAGI